MDRLLSPGFKIKSDLDCQKDTQIVRLSSATDWSKKEILNLSLINWDNVYLRWT